MKPFFFLFLFSAFIAAAQENEQQQEDPASQQVIEEQKQEQEEEKPESDFKPIKYEYVFPIELEKLHQLDLEEVLEEKDIVWLKAEDKKILALLSRSEIGRRRGIAIMVPDWTQNQLSSGSMRYLRKGLNSLGWITLSVLPPKHIVVSSDNLKSIYFPDSADEPITEKIDKPEPEENVEITAPDENTEGDENEDQLEEEQSPSRNGLKITVSKEPLPPRLYKSKQGQEALTKEQIEKYQERLATVMKSTLQQARRFPGYYVVVAEGTSAAWLNKMYAERKLGKPHAMIVIAPYMPEHKLNSQVALNIAQSGAPTLDFYSQSDNRWALSTVKDREKTSKKYFKLNYRQREVFGLPGTQTKHELMLREIYGWFVAIGMM